MSKVSLWVRMPVFLRSLSFYLPGSVVPLARAVG